MSRDSLIFGIAGVFFGVLVGWIVGSQQGTAARQAAPAPQQAAAPSAPPQGQQTAAPLDESRAANLRQAAERDPKDARVRAELGNVYFDAERFQDASRWYEESLKIDPNNVNASTDLGISYYYMNQPDRALAQFDRSLAIDPRHAKTLLNIGIVRAYAKEDLGGAVEVWKRVLEVAPDSTEGKVARQALDAIRNSHPNVK
jgi:cytochrome c-type biogenesis protein CcmH/NrfG